MLCNAWMLYRQGELQSAINLITHLQSESSLVRDLALLLKGMMFIRQARLSDARTVSDESCEDEDVQALLETIKSAADLSARKDGSRPLLPDPRFIDSIPFRDEDNETLRLAFSYQGGVHGTRELESGQDWLLLLIAFGAEQDERKKIEAATLLLEVRDSIPPSPERNEIIDVVTDYTGKQ